MRVALLVIDSGGVGAAADAEAFGDAGSDTLGHVMRARNLRLPHLSALGLRAVLGVSEAPLPVGWAARVRPESAGKDSMAGHWAMMGIVIDRPFVTYPNGFPPDLRGRLEAALGTPVLGMEIASGTEIVADLGVEHLRTGFPIVYTSADSVLQIAAHEDRIPPARLYALCRSARAVMQGEDRVGRIIARPFEGRPGAFVRTDRRRDFTVGPPGESVLTRLTAHGIATVGVGKIDDIFSGQGLSRSEHVSDNRDALKQTEALLQSRASWTAGPRNDSDRDRQSDPTAGDGFLFVNLGDFDTKWGHRRDMDGYARGLEALDAFLPGLLQCLGPRDQLWISADHGCDPAFRGTDHTREDVPWLVAGPALPNPGRLGRPRGGMADLGATLLALFGIDGRGLPGRVARDLLPGPG